jgi:hypothetical protein
MTGEAPIRRNVARYGDGPWTVDLGPPSAFDSPEETLADRYSALARLRSDGALQALTVTDRVSGATFGWTARRMLGVTLRVSSDETAAKVDRLLRDGRDILGLARRQTGGPARGTGITMEDLIRGAITLQTADGWPTEDALAQHVGRTERTVRRIAPYQDILARASERVRREP